MRGDLEAVLLLRDARAAENARARSAALANTALVSALRSDAERRGQREIDWPEYFRNIDINYP